MAMAIWESLVANKAFSAMEFFLKLLLNGVSVGFLYGISAIGLILIYRSGGLLNFAHGGMMSFGAFLFFALSVQANRPIIVSFAVTLVSGFALGLILEKCFIRPVFLKKNLIHKILITLGLALMLKGLLSFFFGDGVYHLPSLISDTFSINWHNLQIKSFHISAIAAGAILLTLYWFFFTFSSCGLSIRAFAEKPSRREGNGCFRQGRMRSVLGHCSPVVHPVRCVIEYGQWSKQRLTKRGRTQSFSRYHPWRAKQHQKRHFGRHYRRPA